MGRRFSDKVVSRDVILRAATREFIDQGFHGARIDRIAKIGKFNKAMIYYHFKSKQAIYEEVIKSVVLTIIGRFNTFTASQSSSVEDLISHMYDTYIQVAREYPEYIRLTIYEFIRGGQTLGKMKILRWQDVPFNPINGSIYLFLKKKMREGVIRKMNVLQLILTIIGQIIPSVVLVFIRDIISGFKLPINPVAVIDSVTKNRKAFVIEMTMRALASDKGGS
jgi:TetR/AcrR family transcriptional regulator